MMQKPGSLLIDEPPIIIIPSLAALLGFNEAAFLQQLHYWSRMEQLGRMGEDGERWIRNTNQAWLGQLKWMTLRTFQRTIKKLEEDGVLLSTDKLNKMAYDGTKWYRIDYDRLYKIRDGMLKMDGGGDKLSGGGDKMADPIPEITTETTKKEREGSLSPMSERQTPETEPKRKQSDLDRIKTELFEFFVAEAALAAFMIPKEGPGRAKTCYQPLIEMYSTFQPEYVAADGSKAKVKYSYNPAAIEKTKALIRSAVKYNRQNGLAIKNVLSILSAANTVATNGVVTRDTLREIKYALRRYQSPTQAAAELNKTTWGVIERMNVDWRQMGNMTEFEINRLFTQVTGVS